MSTRRQVILVATVAVAGVLFWANGPALLPDSPEYHGTVAATAAPTPAPQPAAADSPNPPPTPRRASPRPDRDAPPIRDAQGRLRWRGPVGTAAVDEYRSAGYRTRVHFDQLSCQGWLETWRESGCGQNQMWSKEGAVSAWVKRTFGPEHIRVHVRGPEVVLGNLSHLGDCHYVSHFELTRPGEYALWADVLHDNYDAINELKEKTWYEYVFKQLTSGRPTLRCRRDGPPAALPVCQPDLANVRSQSLEWGRWVDDGPGGSVADFKRKYPGYWLNMGKRETRVNDHTPDLLGRLDFRRTYRWEPYRCAHKHYPRSAMLELLRNREIYFFGDSHMRMTFYGVLHRLGVQFPFDKVWRGDRSDVVDSHNATFTFVASYFLNTSRPTAQQMLQRLGSSKRGIVVAGVGQHHASGCWTLRRHAGVVEAALDAFHAQRTPVVWMGVPAHPMNVHMRVVQHRTDCRNNLRHRLLNKVQYELVRRRGHPIVDVFAKSDSMIHTSPDGAHYFGWVRDAWIDDIFASVDLLIQKGVVK